jgi:hypothetical protein
MISVAILFDYQRPKGSPLEAMAEFLHDLIAGDRLNLAAIQSIQTAMNLQSLSGGEFPGRDTLPESFGYFVPVPWIKSHRFGQDLFLGHRHGYSSLSNDRLIITRNVTSGRKCLILGRKRGELIGLG